jgi:hypothetical protein
MMIIFFEEPEFWLKGWELSEKNRLIADPTSLSVDSGLKTRSLVLVP